MAEYVNRCYLEINGQAIDDFKAVTEKEVEMARQVNLMNKTGHAAVTPRYGVSVDYVVPEDASEFDFEEVKDGTLVIEYLNGKRKLYTGVRTLKIGESKVDGENDVVRTIEFGATDYRPE
jgi:hypothetical protein